LKIFTGLPDILANTQTSVLYGRRDTRLSPAFYENICCILPDFVLFIPTDFWGQARNSRDKVRAYGICLNLDLKDFKMILISLYYYSVQYILSRRLITWSRSAPAVARWPR